MSKIKPFLVLLLAGLFLSACTHTTVVLMPDEDGKVGAISVKTKEGEQTVDKAYNYTAIRMLMAQPSAVRATSAEKVQEKYGKTLQAQPSKPVSYILYFVIGTSDLTPESQAMVPKVIATVKERSPTEISIIGHTDTTGSSQINAKISMERAQAVEVLLRNANSDLGRINLKYFGLSVS